MEDIRRICNPTVDLPKFISNKKILSKVVVGANCLVCSNCIGKGWA